MLRRTLTGLAVVTFAACSFDSAGPGPGSEELALARDAQVIAQDVGATTGTTYDRWFARLLDTLRTTDDPEAQAFVQQAREYRELARRAREAGDYAAAREYLRLSFRALLAAVIEIYPNAPARTGAAVDEAVARIELRLGDREAPRIRRVLTHVRELRNEADRALANGDPVTALAINLRAMQILHRMVDHLRHGNHEEHDRAADREMEDAGA